MIRKARPDEMDTVRLLFRQYEAELGLDLCFQGFEQELAELPGKYNEPEGCILLYIPPQQKAGGVVALHQLEAEVCEMKRLYVSPESRHQKAGYFLVTEVLNEARKKGYKEIRLDTLRRFEAAIRIYRDMGFEETNAYTYNPDKTVIYFSKTLSNG